MNSVPATFAGANSRPLASGSKAGASDNWKIVKNFQTRVTVLRKFGAKCRIETTWVGIQCSALRPAEQVLVSTQVEESTSESAVTEKKKVGKLETKKARGVCKDLGLDKPSYYKFFQTLSRILKDPPGGKTITESLVAEAITVWNFAPRIPTNKLRGQVIGAFVCIFVFLVNGAGAQSLDESRKQNSTDGEAEFYVKAVLTALAVLVGGAGIARVMYNRWRPLPAVAPAPIAAAVPAPVAAAAVARAPPVAAPAVAAAVAVAPVAPAAWDVDGGLGRHRGPANIHDMDFTLWQEV